MESTVYGGEGMSLQPHHILLETFIGTGPKDFKLLSTTQEIYYNQGPTVAVLYYSNNTIFGGYTRVNWNITTAYDTDDEAFLFQLLFEGQKQYCRFPVIPGGHKIGCVLQFDLPFGICLDDSQCNCNCVLYPYYQMVHKFYNQILDAFDCNAYDLQRVEIYKVVDKDQELESPWRKSLPWKKESVKELKDLIENYKPPDASSVSESRILMMGPVGAGKSSFFNTIDFIFTGYMAQRAYARSAAQSVTNTYNPYKITSHSTNKNMRFRLCDVRGMEDIEKPDLTEFNYLLEGNVPNGYKFDGNCPISPDTPGFIRDPKIQDKMHCVLFVFDITTVDITPKSIMDKIKDMLQRLIQRGVPLAVILTKVDKLSAIVKADVSKIYLCEKVKVVVDKVSQTLGIPHSNIFPIKNYENETEMDQNIDILALQVLKQVLGVADGYLRNYLSRIERIECPDIAQMNTTLEMTSIKN